MKDIFNREIKIGDLVACRRTGSRDLVIGEVVRFGAKQVVVDYKYRNIKSTVKHYPQNVCKQDGSIVESLIKKYQLELDNHSISRYWTDREYERAESRRDTLEDVITDLTVKK